MRKWRIEYTYEGVPRSTIVEADSLTRSLLLFMKRWCYESRESELEGIDFKSIQEI